MENKIKTKESAITNETGVEGGPGDGFVNGC